ncbi:MAG: hypothetical protein HQL18_04020, partial [Candidatus Omnitrophica bacterium]|nr:hypothetical protein [Candidatus Omnitrophota bacterium]
TGNLNYTADGIATVATNKTVNGSVVNSTGTNSMGTLVFQGNSAMTGTIGASGAALKEVKTTGASGTTASFANSVYATTMTVGGTGSVALNANLNGDLNYTQDGRVDLKAGNNITGLVKASAVNTGTPPARLAAPRNSASASRPRSHSRIQN